MHGREILVKLQEGRIQSKYIKPNHVLICKLITEKISWKSRPVFSSPNPLWNEKNLIPLSSKYLKIELHQTADAVKEQLLAQKLIPMIDLINNKQFWWSVSIKDIQIGTVFIEILVQKSPRNSPLSFSQEFFSFRILGEDEKQKLQQTQLKSIHEEKNLDDKKLKKYIEKINNKSSKIAWEKLQIKEMKNNIKLKEAYLAGARREVEMQKKEIADEKVNIKKMILELNRNYSELKFEKFKQKTRKALLENHKKSIRKTSIKINNHKKLIGKISEYTKVFLAPHSVLGMSERVNPIIHDTDSPPNDSPTNTQESI